jgi:uncharacterized protein
VEPGRIITKEDDIERLLQSVKTIAVLGLSPKPERDSYKVAKYLQENGYRILPVRPGQKEILGEKAYASLDEIDEPVDMIDVFRNPDQVMAHAREALRLKPKVFWMQLGIQHPEAARLLAENGIDVVMNRCTKVDHERLVKKTRLL